MDKKAVYEVIDSKASEFAALSDAIWDYAELAFTEHQSAEALCRQLEKEGFAVTRGVAGIETAFTARYGSGKPVIGILGEFDALSGLSQKAGCAVREPLCPGAAGHGCGHNALGAGAMAAAAVRARHSWPGRASLTSWMPLWPGTPRISMPL